MTQPTENRPAALEIQDAQIEVPDSFKKLFRACMRDVLFNWPDETVTWIVDQVAVRGSAVPIGQVIGSRLFVPQTVAPIPAAETTMSTAYTNLATVGPTLTGLPDGRYVVFVFAGAATDTPGELAFLAPSLNGATADDDDGAFSATATVTAVSGFSLQELNTGGNNELKLKYRSTDAAATVTFSERKILAIRYANI